jgi:AcrR family transcriptional regulator
MARRNEHTRDEIRALALEAAFAIVDAEGYRGLTARKIAQAIGYTPGTLYVVFRNLDEIVLCLNAATLDSLHQTLQDAVRAAGTPRAALLACAARYIHTAFERKGRWTMIFEHRLPKGEPLPDWFRAKVDRAFGLVEQELAELAPRRAAAECALAARTLWSGLHGIGLLALQGNLAVTGSPAPEAMAESLVSNFLAGFLQQEVTP